MTLSPSSSSTRWKTCLLRRSSNPSLGSTPAKRTEVDARRSSFVRIYPWFLSHLLMFSPPQWTPNPPGRGHTSDEPRRSDGSIGPSPWTPAGSLCVCEHVCTCGVPPLADYVTSDLFQCGMFWMLVRRRSVCTHAAAMVIFQKLHAAGILPPASRLEYFHFTVRPPLFEMLWSSSSCNNLLQQKCSFVEPPTSSVLLQTSVSYICLYIVVLVFMLDISRNMNPQTSCRKCPFENEQNVLVLVFHCVQTNICENSATCWTIM